MINNFHKAFLFTSLGLLLLTNSLFAQNEVDALRYSTTYHGGTARFMSMGGAFSALGSDISSGSINPAGIGLYRSSDVQYSAGIDYIKTKSNYLNELSTDNKYGFNMQSFGLVFSMPNAANYESGSGQVSVTFGVSYNRINSFNQDVFATGRHGSRSYLTHLTDRYNQNIDYWDLFWDTGVLYEDTATGIVMNDFDRDTAYQIKQFFEHRQRGNINDFNFTIGFNQSNKFYYGFSLGVSSLYHTEDIGITENDDQNLTQFLKGFYYNNYFSRSGLGLNLKAGILYQVASTVKLSLAVHTPTIISIDENLDEKLHAHFDNTAYDTIAAKYYETSFSVVTPARIIAGASMLLANRVLIGVDYETAAYQTMRLDSDTYSYTDENRSISDNYTWRHALRIGAELRVYQFFVRGGGFYYSSPMKSAGSNMSTLGFAGGLGFRSGNFYADFAYNTSSMPYKYYIDGTDDMRIDIDKTSNNFYLTFGLRF
ncbi:MAG TPA: hypothetical protein PLS84_03045 [Salinivirgaceae bacterium]|nr:hypothetical protein [Salinivirgaceae bacterium]